MAITSCLLERSLAVTIGLFVINLLPSEQYFHQFLMSVGGGKEEQCSAVTIRLVGIDFFSSE